MPKGWTKAPVLDGWVQIARSASEIVSVIEDPADVTVPGASALRDALRAMDDVDMERIFTLRASVMRSAPQFLHGPFLNAMKNGSGGNLE